MKLEQRLSDDDKVRTFPFLFIRWVWAVKVSSHFQCDVFLNFSSRKKKCVILWTKSAVTRINNKMEKQPCENRKIKRKKWWLKSFRVKLLEDFNDIFFCLFLFVEAFLSSHRTFFLRCCRQSELARAFFPFLFFLFRILRFYCFIKYVHGNYCYFFFLCHRW